jgi:hypothetical protein
MDREEYKVRQFARNYSAGESTLNRPRRRGLTMKQHTFYVVVNSAGEYLYEDTATDDRGHDLGYPIHLFGPFHFALLMSKTYAQKKANLFGGTVKRVTITIEED